MRNPAPLPVSLFILLLAMLLISCKKTGPVVSASEKTLETNDFKFLHTQLKQFATVFAAALKEKAGRDFITSKAKQKFDEEYEVLIKDLFKDKQINLLVPEKESRKLHDALFERSGEHLYPQIYIPRLQYLEDYPEERRNAVSRTETETPAEDPVYVFYSGDPEADSASMNEIWPGYKLVNGQYQFFTMVDETYANEHEVWVFSLNETVNAAGLLPVPCEVDPCAPGCPLSGSPDCGGGTGGGTAGGPDDDPTDAPSRQILFPELGHNKINFKMTSMKVHQHKETWVAGASEVAIRAKLVCHNGRDMGVAGAARKEYSSDQYSNYLGKKIKKVKRKDIKDGIRISLDYSLQTNWQNQIINQDPIHFFYVIFERDKWPATKNKNMIDVGTSMETLELSPETFPLWYRAGGSGAGYDSPYHQYFFSSFRRSWWDRGYPLNVNVNSPGVFEFSTVSY
jgi:hypothetical protein